MQMDRKEIIDGKTVITTSTPFFHFWFRIREFEAQREFPANHWDWLELPNRTLIPDMLSFQLNAWMRIKP